MRLKNIVLWLALRVRVVYFCNQNGGDFKNNRHVVKNIVWVDILSQPYKRKKERGLPRDASHQH